MNFTKVIFRPIKRLKLIRSFLSERSATFIQCYQEKIQQSPLQYSALFALRQSHMELMTFQTINKNMRTSQELDLKKPLKITVVKFTYPGQRSEILSLCHDSILITACTLKVICWCSLKRCKRWKTLTLMSQYGNKFLFVCHVWIRPFGAKVTWNVCL